MRRGARDPGGRGSRACRGAPLQPKDRRRIAAQRGRHRGGVHRQAHQAVIAGHQRVEQLLAREERAAPRAPSGPRSCPGAARAASRSTRRAVSASTSLVKLLAARPAQRRERPAHGSDRVDVQRIERPRRPRGTRAAAAPHDPGSATHSAVRRTRRRPYRRWRADRRPAHCAEPRCPPPCRSSGRRRAGLRAGSRRPPPRVRRRSPWRPRGHDSAERPRPVPRWSNTIRSRPGTSQPYSSPLWPPGQARTRQQQGDPALGRVEGLVELHPQRQPAGHGSAVVERHRQPRAAAALSQSPETELRLGARRDRQSQGRRPPATAQYGRESLSNYRRRSGGRQGR